MSFKIGSYEIEHGALIPYKVSNESNQKTQIDGEGGVIVTSYPYDEKFITAKIKVSAEKAELLEGFLTQGVNYSSKPFYITDGFGVQRLVRYWDNKVDKNYIASNIVEMNLTFRVEV